MLCLMQCASLVLIYYRLSLLNLKEISDKLLYQAMSIMLHLPYWYLTVYAVGRVPYRQEGTGDGVEDGAA